MRGTSTRLVVLRIKLRQRLSGPLTRRTRSTCTPTSPAKSWPAENEFTTTVSTLTARIGSPGGAVEEQATNKKDQQRKVLGLFFSR